MTNGFCRLPCNGDGFPAFPGNLCPNMGGKNYAQFIVNATSVEATADLLDEYANAYADYYPDAFIKFKQLDYQTVSFPIEVRFMGDDITALKQVADTLMTSLQDMDGLVWVHTNFEEMLPEVRVTLDPVESSRLGISKAMAAADMAIRYNGMSVGSVWEGDYPLAICLKSDKEDAYDSFDRIGMLICRRLFRVSVFRFARCLKYRRME